MSDGNREFGLLRDSFNSIVSDLASAREELALWIGLCIGLLFMLAAVFLVAVVAFFII